jgi:hypothetical protein
MVRHSADSMRHAAHLPTFRKVLQISFPPPHTISVENRLNSLVFYEKKAAIFH